MIKKIKNSNREIVLEVATNLFLKKGYLVTSMDDIVAESKVSKTNIYYYFKSKEELLSAIIDRIVQQYHELIYGITSRTDLPVQERIALLVHLLTEQDVECLGGCPFLTLYTQTSQEAGWIREKINRFFQDQIISLEKLIIEGIQNKELNDQLPPRQTAALIVSTIEGGLFLQHATHDPSLIQDAIHSLAFMLK
ncbi:TetR/AcrR family transcriptional regulator [Paenibacillus caui]|uniref:TetR/AcrR family transcriptional regulator n=1 Tax=Paenibacillus caui TaxID=2873927 RepID=UPI002356F22C|nr:TetR/AcrR family transcriptional regulator [Paenibacillus caui]